MTTIYLIRHAEAEGNLYRRVQGHMDGGVTLQGHKQIEALAERFKNIPIDALYTSDLRRAVATAGAILKYHALPLIATERLREVYLGCWEGRPWGEVERADPEQMRYFQTDCDRWRVKGGESFQKLAGRMAAVIRDIAAENDGKTVAVVSHGMAIRTLVCTARGIPSCEVSRIPHGDNTAVTLLEVTDGEIEARYINDTAHLTPEISTFAKQTWWREDEEAGGNNLRFEPMDPGKERALYIACYEDAWRASHGTTEGFVGELYWKSALRHARENPLSLVKALCGEDFAGLVETDLHTGAAEGLGWISLLYLLPDFRGRRLGVQLLGHAVALFRELGREKIGLFVAEPNAAAIGFYGYYGFEKTGEADGVLGTLYRMELALR